MKESEKEKKREMELDFMYSSTHSLTDSHTRIQLIHAHTKPRRIHSIMNCMCACVHMCFMCVVKANKNRIFFHLNGNDVL